MKTLGFFGLIFCATTVAFAQKVTIVSNLGKTATAVQGFGNVSNYVAGSFLTDNTPGSLATVSIPIYSSFHPFGGLGPVVVSLLSNAGGLPGSNLTMLSGIQFPTNTPATYTFTNTSPLTLAPNSGYWVVF